MDNIEVVEKAYKHWQYINDHLLEDHSESNKRLMFLSRAIIGLETDNDDLDIEFGKMFLDTIIAIDARTTYEYIKNDENHRKYIISCNFIPDWIDYGASIRGAWFDYDRGKIHPDYCLENIEGYNKTYIKVDKAFMNCFIRFLKN